MMASQLNTRASELEIEWLLKRKRIAATYRLSPETR